jgi:tetratricopeptide (TPR) repeat protein
MIALSVLTLLSLTSAIVAVQARKDAEKRELESRRLTEYLLGPLAEELRSRGILGLLGEVGTEAINYLGDRDIENMSLSELSNTARAYRTVGEALLQIKSAEQAEKSFRQAYALADLAIRRSPNHEDALFERGNASFWIGRLDFEEKRYKAAKTHWEKYHEDSKTLLSIAPKKPRSQLEISYAENLLGTAALRQGDTETAMPYFMASLARKKALVESYPDELEYRYEYIDSVSWITTTLEASGKLFEAASEYDRQIAMLHNLISMKKSNNKWKHRIANYLMLSATLEMGRNNKTKARARAVEAVIIMKRLVDTYPETEEWSRDLAKARLILAESEAISSNRIATAEELKEILKIAAKIDAESRKSVAWRSIEARARLFLSTIDENAHKYNEIDHAIEELSALARKNGSDDLIEAYAYGLLLRGIMHARTSSKELATQDFHSSIRAIETTEWKKNPYRSWIWSIAQTMAGNVEDAKPTVRWLAEIGYSRPIPGTNAPIQIPD